MKNKVLIGGIAAVAMISIAILIFYFYSVRPLDLFGQTVRADAEEYTLKEDVKEPLDVVLAALKQLNRVKKLDLGSYRVEVREEDKLLAAFPNTELKYDTYVSLYGLALDPDETEVDLSDRDISDLTEMRETLPYLPKMTSVVSTGTVVSRTDLESLREAFPKVSFDMISNVDVYGSTIRDDIVSLDLTDVDLGDHLADNLRLLPKLQEVDLRGQGLSAEEQLALVKEFPDIAFGWEVSLLGSVYDSYTENLDLSGNGAVTTDMIRQVAPLFPKLTRIDMSDCGIDNETMAALRKDLPGVNVVWRLRLGQKWSLKTDAVAFSVLIGDYSHRRMTSADIEVLKYCTNLQALDLGHQAITDISVIGEYLTELRLLVLVDNAVSDLSPVANLKHLHYIELFVNSRNLSDISPLAKCKELVDVNVSYLYSVTDFSPLFDLPLLERLWMEHTQINSEQLQYIINHYPNATIITQGSGSIDNGWRTHERYYDAWGRDGFFHDPSRTALPESYTKFDGKAS